jgi:carbon monoxide dehydrogenase subunit G
MLQASHTLTIARPPADVFSFLADAENEREWRPGVLDLKLESGQGAGAIYHQGVKGPGGRRVTADFEWTTYEPNSALAFRTIAGPVRPRGEFRLEPAGEATRLTFNLETEITGLKKLLMGRMVAKTMNVEVHNIENVKRILEGESPSTD